MIDSQPVSIGLRLCSKVTSFADCPVSLQNGPPGEAPLQSPSTHATKRTRRARDRRAADSDEEVIVVPRPPVAKRRAQVQDDDIVVVESTIKRGERRFFQPLEVDQSSMTDPAPPAVAPRSQQAAGPSGTGRQEHDGNARQRQRQQAPVAKKPECTICESAAPRCLPGLFASKDPCPTMLNRTLAPGPE